MAEIVASNPSNRSIAVTLLTGFLGSGKTTLLNYLLAHPGMDESAVIINEFGEVGLDHLIVRELDEDVVLLKSGCICCTVQGQLVEGLKELYLKRLSGKIPCFKRLLIETTGLADPLPILDCLMRDPLFKHVYRVDTVVTTVDAVYGSTQLEEHNEAVNQAAIADHILITKCDLASENTVRTLLQALSDINRRAAFVKVQFGEVSPSLLFRADVLDQEAKLLEVRDRFQETHDHDENVAGRQSHHLHGSSRSRHAHISSFCLVLKDPVDWDVVREWYEEFAEKKADHLLRVKGILNIRGSESPYFMHCVRSTIHEPWPLPEWPDKNRETRIVFITRDLAREEIEVSFRAYIERVHSDRLQPGNSRGLSRWLNQAELTRLFAALADLADWSAANAVRLTLLTGANIDEVEAAAWEDFDIDSRIWSQTTKGLRSTKRCRKLALHESAVLLLVAMRTQGDVTGRLFPDDQIFDGRVSKAWEAACHSAGVDAVDIKSLPPTLATDIFVNLDEDLIRSVLALKRAHTAAAGVSGE